MPFPSSARFNAASFSILSTGMRFDMACGSYTGNETGESALMRELLDVLHPGDTLVADSLHGTSWLVAACERRGVGIVMKNHHRRADQPSGSRRLKKGQRLVAWSRPKCADGMNEEEYEPMPPTVEIRLMDVPVPQAGFRPSQFTVATTLTDDCVFPATWIRSVDQSR